MSSIITLTFRLFPLDANHSPPLLLFRRVTLVEVGVASIFLGANQFGTMVAANLLCIFIALPISFFIPHPSFLPQAAAGGEMAKFTVRQDDRGYYLTNRIDDTCSVISIMNRPANISPTGLKWVLAMIEIRFGSFC